MACPLAAAERVWIEKSSYHDAEREYYERLAKLLKGTEHSGPTESPQLNLGLEKSKKKTRRIVTKSKSPEAIMAENVTVVSQKPVVPVNATISRPKTQKKQKVVEPENAVINLRNDTLVTSKTEEVAEVVTTEGVEETKSKKKKKRKPNKDAAEKLHDLSHKENVPPCQPILESKVDCQNSGKKIKNGDSKGPSSNQCTLVSEIAKARQHIKNSLEKMDGIATLAASPASPEILDRLAAIERDNADLRKLIEGLKNLCFQSENRVKTLEQKLAAMNLNNSSGSPVVGTPASAQANKKVDDDDGVDLFGSDSEDDGAEATRIREERLAAYAAKKSKKPALIAKSSVVLDVKPWDDETDMKLLESEVRKITTEGLLWGASKLVSVAFGIQKLSIMCVVEDDKVSIDWLTEEIEKLEDYVQSVDVAAFNKI